MPLQEIRVATKSSEVEDVLERLDDAAEEDARVSVGDAAEKLRSRGYGPFLFVPALIEITPVGAIPGVPTMLALIILLFAVQLALGREAMWLPGWLRRRSISDRKLRASIERIRPLATRLDRWFPGRIPSLTGKPAVRIAAAVTVMLCLSVPPLELLPFASSVPMAAIAIFGLAMTLRDGLLMAAGFVLTAIAVPAVIFMASGG
jgi:hypothetical protein